jgi:hypothetical protein
MSLKPSPERRLWNLFMILHGVTYTFFWAAAIYQVMRMDGYNLQVSVLQLVLFWLPLFILHVATHAYYLSRAQSGEGERQAYREGYSDAMHYKPKHVLEDADNLYLSDDGELIELPIQAQEKSS